MSTSPTLPRRDFLRLSGLVGAGLVLGAYLRPLDSTWAADVRPGLDASHDGAHLNAFVRIAPDGRVYIASHVPEIGQGVRTSLPMIVAEELDVAWESVTVELVPFDQAYRFQMAGGSRSTPNNYTYLRQAGATARALLVSAAAQTWGVSPDTCRTDNGQVFHDPSQRSLGYGQLVDLAKTLPLPAPESVTLKSPDRFRIIGQRIGGVDNRAITAGRPLFGIDQVHDGQLHAVYVKCPVFGGKVRSADLDAVKRLPGVVDAFILEGTDDPAGLRSGVAILARSTWQAFKAQEQLQVVWDEGPHAHDSWADFVQQAQALVDQPGERTARNEGDVTAALGAAARTLKATYTYPFIGHTTLEPQNCTAHAKDGHLTLWAPTQNPAQGRQLVADTLKIAPANITLHITRIGGGFGRRLDNDYMVEAAAIALRSPHPIKLTWRREDDMRHDQYRPGGIHHYQGGLDAAGRLVAWQAHCVTFGHAAGQPGRGAAMSGGEFPAQFVTHYRQDTTVLPCGVPMGWWRAPGSNAHAWVTQSFLSELASAAGQDERAFALALLNARADAPTGRGALNRDRLRAVLLDATDRAGWSSAPLPRGRGRGLAYYYSYGGYFAVVAEVTVTPDGDLTVDRLVVTGDVGSPIINRSGAEHQVLGSMIDGLSAAWLQADPLQGGRIVPGNFHEHPLLRITKAPRTIDLRLLETSNPPTGLGEPALPPVAPAVCNAIFAASGHRIRTLPISQSDLRWS